MLDKVFMNEVLNLYQAENWRDLLKLNENSDLSCAVKLLWVWPSEENLRFIKKIVEDSGCKGITSIGCGCGLLEWIISKSTGLHVIGYEINREWWTSKYSNPQFIKLQYCEKIQEGMFNSNHVLLFCYFNNKVAFQDYIRAYKGNLVLIIGPGNGKGRHTDPEPFDPDFGSTRWTLKDYNEVKDSKDFIAVYTRCIKDSIMYK
nr:uncharacterized protein LOC111518135 [Leptinotarsa decemlineata]